MHEHRDELHPDVKDALPCPGDLIRAQKHMRAWEDIHMRGADGPWIRSGEVATLHSVWFENTQCRLLVWFQGSLTLFSCRIIDVHRNWQTTDGRPMTVSPEALSRLTRGDLYLEPSGPSGVTRGSGIRRPRRPWPAGQEGTDP